jgi:ATP-dependent protease HslVU (ClpYQ) peptidase subunit
MTVIAAIRTPTSVLMGGDSAECEHGAITIISAPKVFKKGGYLFGFAGVACLGVIVEHQFSPPRKTEGCTWEQFMVTSFVPNLKIALGDDASLMASSQVLIGTKGGGIFTLDGSWKLSQSREGYAAIGSGTKYALGSLHSTGGDPRRRLLKALRSAAYFNAYVRQPFTILELLEAGPPEQCWGGIEELSDRSALFCADPDDHG